MGLSRAKTRRRKKHRKHLQSGHYWSRSFKCNRSKGLYRTIREIGGVDAFFGRGMGGDLGAVTVRDSLRIGLQWMGLLDSEDNSTARDSTGPTEIILDGDGIEVPAFRICPEHLKPLDESLNCPHGHAVKKWMVKSGGHVEFDAAEFAA